ncbi:unnamed protein product [Sphagnum troendelagicum]|uniref:Uncharacterized protein n=1 Tax=Sphagnum troendelagicum TaxID=128251 RepID=A0ABP0UQF8_9BRYO
MPATKAGPERRRIPSTFVLLRRGPGTRSVTNSRSLRRVPERTEFAMLNLAEQFGLVVQFLLLNLAEYLALSSLRG